MTINLDRDSMKLAELLTITKKVNGSISREDFLSSLVYVCQTTTSPSLKKAASSYLKLRGMK